MNVFEQLNCIEDSNSKGIYHHDKLPFEMCEEEGKLALYINLDYRIDEGKIPLTEGNLQRLIDSFNP